MSGQTFCKTCDREVEGSLKYHQRCAHFTKVKVIWPEGSMEKIQRNGDTDEFMCSRCEFSSADPNSLKRHAESCVMEYSVTWPADHGVGLREEVIVRNAHTKRFHCSRCSSQHSDAMALKRHCRRCIRFADTDEPNAVDGDDGGVQDDVPYGVVAPDDHIVMDSAELRRLSIFVDTRHSRIGCLNCCTSVRPRSILQHIQRHGFRNVDLDIGDYLAKNFHVQHDDQILPLSTPSLPVFGLDIIQDCVVCPECHRGFAKPDSLRAHHTKVHQGTVRKEAYRSACQTFFRGRARRYFPVDLTKLVPVDSTSDLGLYKLNRPIFTPANAVVQAPANQRSLSLFLASECWISYIEGINSSTVREIVTVPKDDHTIRPLRAHMDHWYRSAQVVLADTAANIVTRVSLGDLHEDHAGAYRMSTLYPTTLDNYSQEAFRLLAFVIRAAAGHLPELPEVIVNDEQVKIVREVVEALSVEQETPRTRPALIPSQWDQLIQRFVMSLFRQKCLPNQHTRWFSPVICFAALDSVTSGGDFKHAYQITQTFAKLVYLGRSAIIVECKEVEKAQSLDAHDALDSLVEWYIWSRGTTPIAYLVATWKYLHTLASADQGMPTIATTDASGETMIIDGELVGRHHIAELLDKVIEEYDEVINSQFLLDLSPEHFELPPYEVVIDDPTNNQAGYSLFDEPRNPFLALADKVIDLWMAHPSLAGRLSYKYEDRIYWVTGQARTLLDAEAHATNLLVAMLMICSGAPPRGEEMAAMAVRNVPGSSLRNVLILKGMLTVTGAYSKTSANQRKDKVTPRVPVLRVRERLLKHFTFYRPAARALVMDLSYSSELIERYYYYLMPGLQHVSSGEDVSNVLLYVTHKYFPVSLKARRLRHIFKFVDRAIRDPTNVLLPHWADEQAGHMTLTANRHYGLTAQMASGPAADERIIGHFKASRDWHRLFGCTALADFLEKHGFGDNSTTSAPVSQPRPAALDISGLVDRLAPQLAALLIPQLQISTRASLTSDFASLASLHAPAPPELPPVRMGVQPTFVVHPGHILRLRKFTRRPDAQFKNVAQASALVAILARQENVLLVGATGLGKTFLAQLIAKEYEPQQITVIVLPLLSLHHDFRRRCSEAGVYATRWKPGFEETRPLGKIVHVSVEHALYKEFGVFLKTLQAQGKLARIWFDEAHLALLHADFRPVFLDLVALRLHDVPLVLTTATCPPHLEETLKSMFCIDRARIIRAPTERREAEYRFTQCTDVSSVIVARTYLRERVKSYDPADRFMVFCRSKADCDSVAVALNVEAYHSEIPEADRDARFDRWLHGGSSRPMPGIAATTLLTQGTDVPHVRDVVFVYLPRDPFEAAQALGRGGRDGAPFVFTVFWSSGDWNTDQNVKFGGEMMKRIVTDARTCRRAWFSSYFDGDNCGQMCATLPGIFCDICQSQVDEEVPTGLDVFPRGILGNAREVNPTAASYVPPRTAHTHVVSIPQGAEPPQAGRARTVPSSHVDGPTAAPLAPCPPAPTAIPLAPCPPEPTPQAANGIPHGPARKPRAQGLFDYRPLGLSGTTALQVSSAWDMPRQPAAPTIQGTWGAGGHGAPSAQPTDEDIEMLDAISLSGSGLVGLGVRMNAAQARRGYTPPRGY